MATSKVVRNSTIEARPIVVRWWTRPLSSAAVSSAVATECRLPSPNPAKKTMSADDTMATAAVVSKARLRMIPTPFKNCSSSNVNIRRHLALSKTSLLGCIGLGSGSCDRGGHPASGGGARGRGGPPAGGGGRGGGSGPRGAPARPSAPPAAKHYSAEHHVLTNPP